jgi:hypothetical protein
MPYQPKSMLINISLNSEVEPAGPILSPHLASGVFGRR